MLETFKNIPTESFEEIVSPQLLSALLKFDTELFSCSDEAWSVFILIMSMTWNNPRCSLFTLSMLTDRFYCSLDWLCNHYKLVKDIQDCLSCEPSAFNVDSRCHIYKSHSLFIQMALQTKILHESIPDQILAGYSVIAKGILSESKEIRGFSFTLLQRCLLLNELDSFTLTEHFPRIFTTVLFPFLVGLIGKNERGTSSLSTSYDVSNDVAAIRVRAYGLASKALLHWMHRTLSVKCNSNNHQNETKQEEPISCKPEWINLLWEYFLDISAQFKGLNVDVLVQSF